MFYKKFAFVVLFVAPVLAMAASELSKRAPDVASQGRPASVPIDPAPQDGSAPPTSQPPMAAPPAGAPPAPGQPFAAAGMPMLDPNSGSAAPPPNMPPPGGNIDPLAGTGEGVAPLPKSGLNGEAPIDGPN